MPQAHEVVKHSFGTFSFAVVLAIVVVIFCIVYLFVRKKGGAKQIDEKAGDEGED